MKLAEYLFARLRGLGVQDIFGVPGDFNLTLLDYVVPAGLRWIGNCNELNAGYAADGYARLKGLSAVVTTYGVGELSAINAIAGAYAERAPVVHIVGKPSTQIQATKRKVHHTMIDGDFEHFARMAKEITVAQVDLCDPATAADLIDHALQQCLAHSRPVYIQVPTDQLEVEVPDERLQQPITASLGNGTIGAMSENEIVEALLARLYAAKSVVLLVDGETRSMGIKVEVNELVRASKLPTFTTTFGKALVDETSQNCYGVYMADVGPLDYSGFFNNCDLVLCFGPHYSTTNTYALRTVPDESKTILFTPEGIQFPSKDGKPTVTAGGSSIKSIIRTLITRFDSAKLSSSTVIDRVEPKTASAPTKLSDPAQPITQLDLIPVIEPLLREGDVVLGETGTAAYLTREMRLPSGSTYLGAATWLSIGYMLPATLGAAVARRTLASEYRARLHGETGAPITLDATNASHGGLNERCILVIGDGSLQMTVQEISTMVAQNLDVLIIVINNYGYTIERCIHGWRAPYNDVHNWRYAQAVDFFGGQGDTRLGWKATNLGELKQVFEDKNVTEGKGVRVVELILDQEDAPEQLMKLTRYPPPKEVKAGVPPL